MLGMLLGRRKALHSLEALRCDVVLDAVIAVTQEAQRCPGDTDLRCSVTTDRAEIGCTEEHVPSGEKGTRGSLSTKRAQGIYLLPGASGDEASAIRAGSPWPVKQKKLRARALNWALLQRSSVSSWVFPPPAQRS